MNKVIITQALKLVCPLLQIYSLYLLFRGHNEPGGGFIGGLILALSFVLAHFMDKQPVQIEGLIKRFSTLVGVGVLGFLLVALLPTAFGKPVFTGLWFKFPVPLVGKLSSVLLFDILVYFVVALSTVFAFFSFVSETKREA